MQELIKTKGLVIRTGPSEEYNRRVVILTLERGKITAFAKGARRQTNRLMSSTDLFVFADFSLYPGRSAYTLTDASVLNYFEGFRTDFEASLYGMYFLEVCDRACAENNDERDMLALLYQSLNALLHPDYDNPFVKMLFDLKFVMLEGEFHRDQYREGEYSETTLYTLDYLMHTKAEKIFGFTVGERHRKELCLIADREKKIFFGGKELKSEEMLKILG